MSEMAYSINEMAYSIKERTDGKWDWTFFASAYGAASGTCPTLASAKVALAIGQAQVLDAPYSEAMTRAMRADPETYASDYPNTNIQFLAS